jgi:hypothetical protein
VVLWNSVEYCRFRQQLVLPCPLFQLFHRRSVGRAIRPDLPYIRDTCSGKSFELNIHSFIILSFALLKYISNANMD